MADVPEPMAVPPDVERRIVSVLFADLVGFTTLSERLDPEDVATVQDAYFGATRETIQRYGGVLEKFIGDAAMAVFGTPRARDDDAERAVRAGLALIGALEQLEARVGLPAGTLQLRVGVNTGEVVHATTGADAGRVTGDTVNTAARFQAAARPGAVLIGELTALSVAETIETTPIGTLELKGKADPVRAWEAIGARAQPSREEALGALRAPMLGRDDELATLRRALDDVAGRRAADRIVIVAPPGVGKSRLLAELARAAAATATVLAARVRPQATAPYESVAQLFGASVDSLGAALADAGVPPTRADVVKAEVRRLAEPPEATLGGGDDLAAERDARFDAWTTALDALAASPELWLVEDVHWAGGDLLAFLDFAGRAPSRHGRLIVATSRPSLLDTAPAWCETTRIGLGPLPPTAAAALVEALLGAALPDRLVAALVERADGTPLFIEELLRTWASIGTLVRDVEAWRLAVEPESVILPPTVQAIYAAQLDDLPPDARAVARRGSVAGRRIPVDALVPLGIAERSGLDRLHRRAFVTGPLNDPITGDGYAYRHALLRDAGYASLARAERARLHVAMARWLETVAADRAGVVAEAIAEHYASARDVLPALATPDLPDRQGLAADAANWYERAADTALALSAPDAAIRQLTRAIELTDPDAPSDRARRRLRLGKVSAASADLEAGIREMETALAEYGDDLDGAADSAFALCSAYMQQIRFDEAEGLATATLDRLGADPAPRRARLMAMRAWAVAAQGRSEGVRAEADMAWEAAQSSGDAELELDVLELVAAARDEIDELDPTSWQVVAERARALGRWRQAITASRVLALLDSEVDPVAALPRLAEVATEAFAHGLTEQVGWVNYTRCETLWVVGDWDAARAVGLEAINLAERYAYERLGFRTWMVLLQIAAQRRDIELVERYDRWWPTASIHFPSTPSPYARVLRAGIAIWRAQARGVAYEAPADDLVDSIVNVANPHFRSAIETLARAWLDAGRREPAAAAARASAAHSEEADATVVMKASAALLDAWVNESFESARNAAELAAGFPAPWWELRARRAMGESVREAEAALGIRS